MLTAPTGPRAARELVTGWCRCCGMRTAPAGLHRRAIGETDRVADAERWCQLARSDRATWRPCRAAPSARPGRCSTRPTAGTVLGQAARQRAVPAPGATAEAR